ncbi:MAG: hypothetical protein QY328_06090 [Anaerolineales bacterium]|nr:MAG: hypothetical protein QY328_06090 [Anaerolineales bacterium]
MRRYRVVFTLLILLLVLSACGMGGNNAATESTLEAISNQVRETGTASAQQGQDPFSVVETAQAAATQALVLSPDSMTATAQAFAPILAELPKYGVDPSQGRLGWVHPPVSLDASGFRQFEYINYFLGTVAADFVISADITWDTVGSTSGCGFVLRSDGNQAAFNQYLAIITRVSSGHFLFATMANGDVVTGRDIYAYNRDKNFKWQNQTTNRLTVVGRGNRFYIYTNDTLIGEIDPSAPLPGLALPPEPERPADQSDAQAMAEYQARKTEYDLVVQQMRADYARRQRAVDSVNTEFERGFIALVALSESGRRTVCEFNNAWLWLIE